MRFGRVIALLLTTFLVTACSYDRSREVVYADSQCRIEQHWFAKAALKSTDHWALRWTCDVGDPIRRSRKILWTTGFFEGVRVTKTPQGALVSFCREEIRYPPVEEIEARLNEEFADILPFENEYRFVEDTSLCYDPNRNAPEARPVDDPPVVE